MLVPVLAYLIIRRSAHRRTPAKTRWLCLLVAAGFLFSWCIKSYQSRWHGDTFFGSVLVQHVGRYQPLGFPVSLALAALDVDGEHQAALQRAKFEYDATSAEKIDTVVFVMGNRHGRITGTLTAILRPTTPELERIPDLISFSNVMSLAPNTVLSWPFFFTQKLLVIPRTGQPKNHLFQPSRKPDMTLILSPFTWIRIPPKPIRWQILFLTRTRLSMAWLASGKNQPIQAMLPAIRKILAAKDPELVVVSTQGSHTGFEGVLPLKYDFFKPSVLSGNDPEAWLNGYDDTVRMTDDFSVNHFPLQAQGSRAVFVYVSDHGLACCDKGENFWDKLSSSLNTALLVSFGRQRHFWMMLAINAVLILGRERRSPDNH